MDRAGKDSKIKTAGAKTGSAARRKPRAADARTATQRLADAQAQQAAVNEILRVMADSPADVKVVLDTIAKEAALLCHAPFARVTVLRDGLLVPLAGYALDGDQPPARTVPARRTSIQGRALLDRRTLHYADIVPLLDREFPDARENARVIGFRAVLAVPLLHGDEGLGAIFLYRRKRGLFTPDEVALVETFARQAAIALSNVRQFHATQEALEQQTATSEILRAISQSQTDVQPVFQTIANATLELCGAISAIVATYDGNLIELAALANVHPAGGEAIQKSFPRHATPASGTARAVLLRSVVNIPDVLRDPDYAEWSAADALGLRSVLSVPLMRAGEAIGVISVWRTEAGAFPESQVALLRTFADQAVIAIENVRLFSELQSRNRDLTEALEQQTATSEILRVISRSQTDVQPVFDTIVAASMRLCRASAANFYTFDGELIHLVALENVNPEYYAAIHGVFPRPPGHDTAVGRAIQGRNVVMIPDVLEERDYAIGPQTLVGGFRSVLAVPLLREDRPIGAIIVGAPEPGVFPDSQIALLQTFADQAVIAIENVRLFTELGQRNRALTEALEQQTATSDILSVISQSQVDTQPVFETIAENALRLCDGIFSAVYRFDGELIHVGALRNITPEGDAAFHKAYPCPPSRGGTTQRAILTRRIVHMPDVRDDPEYTYHEVAETAGFRSVLSVPMLRGGEPIGTITVYRDVARPFPQAQIDLLQTFADQAVIAVENVRLFTELEARNVALTESLEQQTATAEILSVISRSQVDVQPVFDTIATAALKLCRATSVLVTRVERDSVALVASANLTMEGSAAMHEAFPMPISRRSTSARAILEGRIVTIPDVLTDPDYEVQELALRAAFRSTLAVPLMRESRPIGTITVGKPEPGPFSDSQVALLQTFAEQAVIAIENVRLFTELEARNRDLSEALEQQTATSDILRVISQSQTDVQPVFNTIANAVLKFCGAEFANVFTFDGTLIHLAAFVNVHTEYIDILRARYPLPPGRATAVARAIETGLVCVIPDVLADPDYEIANAAAVGGFRSILAVPLLREGKAIGGIAVGRPEAGEFPDSQIALVQTFADQAVIAIENVRLFNELDARNRDLSELLEQQTATSDILRVISQSPTDVQPVFDTIAAAALKLCGATNVNVFTFDGELIHLAALVNLTPAGADAIRRLWPQRPSRGMAASRAIVTGSPVEIPDVLADPDFSARGAAVAGNFRSILAVPLTREGRPIGAIAVGRPEPGPFPDSLAALLETFADQAVIAIENVRLFTELGVRNRDLTEALEQQTATSDILRVISQSQTDVQPVFDTIVGSVLSLCDAAFSGVYLLDRDTLSLAATAGLTADERDAFAAGYPRAIGRDTVSGRAALECRVVQTNDLLTDPDYAGAPGTFVGARTVLGVPLMRDGKSIGSIGVWRNEVKPFSDTQIALLETFADQAVIAIENVRLFKELEVRNRDLTEALEQQTATSDILRVMSRSQTDVRPVFDTIAAAVAKLCGAHFANVFTYDGSLIHLAASVNVNADYLKQIRAFFPRPAGRDTAVTRAIADARVCMVKDVLEDPEYLIASASAVGGFRSILAVPLMREGRAVGGIAVGHPEPGEFPDSQVALLQTFADQAVIAIENVRLFTELEARTAQLTRSVGELRALGDVGQAVSSTLDLGTVLQTIVARATQLAGMDGGSLYEYDETREEFYLHSSEGLPDELLDALRATPMRKGEGALGRMALTGQPVEIYDVSDETAYQSRVRSKLVRLGYRSMLVVPLLREDHLLGGLAVNRKVAGAFDPQVVELLKTFATQSAIAIQNARLFREIEIKSRELETASRHKSEFLANMSHELRTPLNAIIGFSDVLSERLFGEMNDKQVEYVNDIADSGRHLLELINDILDLSKIEAGRMELDASDFDLPKAVGQTLSLVRERAERRGVELRSQIDPDITAVHGDQRKVKQVVLNLLSNALKFTPEGGAIDVGVKVFDDRVEVSVKDTGVGIAPEDQETVFEEFRQVGARAAQVEGTGLGLAISRKFIELHGGRLWLESAPGKGSTFTFSLPRR